MAETIVEAITEEEKSARILKAEEKLRQAKVELRKVKSLIKRNAENITNLHS